MCVTVSDVMYNKACRYRGLGYVKTSFKTISLVVSLETKTRSLKTTSLLCTHLRNWVT